MFFNSHTNPHESFILYQDPKFLLELQKSAGPASRSQDWYSSVKFLEHIDEELIQVWEILSTFCSVINYAVESGQCISTETFLDTMVSVMYRLLNMGPLLSDSRDELFRLGLLAFSSTIFLQWKQLGVAYAHLTSTLRVYLVAACRQTPPSTSASIPPQIKLWLLMIGAVSVFEGPSNDWLKPLMIANVRLCEIDSWCKLRDLLKSFMWIDLVHDKMGKSIFDSTMASMDSKFDEANARIRGNT